MKKLQNQSGVSIIAAIFIIVILAFMGMVFLTLSTSTTSTSINELQSTRALYVAEGGLERGIRYFTAPTLTERVACASIPATNTSLGSGEFSLTIEAGSPFYSSAATTLSGAIGAGDTTINVGTTAGYATFGRIMIDRELIDYTGVTANSFTGVLRGRDGTTATSHANGTRVGQNQCTVTSTGGVYNLTTPNARRQVREGIQLQEGWAVGNRVGGGGGEIIIRWDAVGSENTWVRFGPSAAVPNVNLRSVSMLSYAEGWAVGNAGAGASQLPLILWWNGAAWATRNSNLNINVDLNSIYCVSTNDCWTVGNASGGELILHWDGASWLRVGPSAAIPDVTLRSVYCVNSNDCWIVGDQSGGELILHWDGVSWTRIGPSGAIPNVNLRSIYIVGPKQRPQAMWMEVFQ